MLWFLFSRIPFCIKFHGHDTHFIPEDINDSVICYRVLFVFAICTLFYNLMFETFLGSVFKSDD